jgi:predicted phosphodiesterase
MRIAVIADVHSNVHALRSVLDALERHTFDLLIVLGDLVGYNAFPKETIELIRSCADAVVAGNHDVETVSGSDTAGTTSNARSARTWTRDELDEGALAYLRSLPNKHVVADAFVAVHGCYLNDHHVNGYVSTTMLEKNLRAVAANPRFPRVAFCGHTHAPLAGILRRGEVEETRLHEPLHWSASAEAVLLNPGAVGQPRDGDPRSAYAIVDFEKRCAEVFRVAYDVKAAASAVLDAGLPPRLAKRLEEGC